MKKNHSYLIICLAFFLTLIIGSYLNAQKKDLTYKQVYLNKGEKLFHPLPHFVKWLNDSHYIQIKRSEDQKKPLVYQKVNIKTGTIQPYKEKKAGNNLPKEFKISLYTQKTKDAKACLFTKNDDIFYYSIEKDIFKELTKTKDIEKNPTFSPDGKRIAFTRNNDLFIIDISSKKEIRLTHDGSEKIYNGKAAWVYYEEIIGRGLRYRAFWWSPDSKNIVFLRFDETNVPAFTLVKAKGVHGDVKVTPYPKPGDPNPKVRMGIAAPDKHKITWIKTDPNADHYIAWPFWTEDGKTLFFQILNRDQNHLNLYSANLSTGEKTKIYEEKQKSWVDFFSDLYFLKNNKGFILRSDKDGWSHLYLHKMNGELINQVTKGAWRVSRIQGIDHKDNIIYFTGFLKESTENHLFKVKLDGTGLKKLTKEHGTHRIILSPNFKYFIDNFSNIYTPTIRKAYKINGIYIRTLGNSITSTLSKYNLGKTEIFKIPTNDGFYIPAVWTLPPNLDKNKKYPVLLGIYGGPQSGTVRNFFPRLRSFYLASKRIIVLSIDHRGAGHFGKKAAALMHRQLGKWEIHDYSVAVKWLTKLPFVDPKRIGITGSSYGGYITCLALTKGSKYFTHGLASSSVTDWQLYDSVYTERYMDTPKDNPIGYKDGSVMTYAEELKGVLHIVHGEMDDNVHMQNSIQLISKLQDLNKDFTLMVYPDGRHGWRGNKRKHSTRLSVQFWFKHFLNKELDINHD